MRYWAETDMAGGFAPRKIARIRNAVQDAIAESGWPGVELVRLGRADDEFDESRFEIDVRLAAGVVLPTCHGAEDALANGWEDKSQDVERIYDLLVEGLEACRDLLPSIADILDDVRRRSRKVMAAWQREGLPAELVDVRLAPYDHWRGDTVPCVQILFEALAGNLRPSVEEVNVDDIANLEQELDAYRPALVERTANRMALADRGATGTIDQLALNAIAHFGDVPTFLRQYATEVRLWLPDSTAVHLDDGHVSANTGVSNGPVDWHADAMTFATTVHYSQEELAAAVGQPAATLFDHPFLSPDMTISAVESSIERDQQFVTVDLRMSRCLFCSVTGRVWAEEEEEGPEEGTVVPFRRSAG